MIKGESKLHKESSGKESTCCKVESLVTVDERGQMVLPKEIRDAACIRPGDKLFVIPWKKDNKVCCITLVRTEEFADAVKNKLGPILKDII